MHYLIKSCIFALFFQEMQSSMNMFNQPKDLPDISDWFAKNFSSGIKKKTTSKTAQKKPIVGSPRRR